LAQLMLDPVPFREAAPSARFDYKAICPVSFLNGSIEQ
jgi:hypothetical protein